MEALLAKLGVINLKYEILEDENQFNIFTTLRKYNDEVNLHSRFIFELLNPLGTHRKEDKFLSLFLDAIELEDFELNDVSVYKERENIDILITNANQAIIIENKIYAGDQKNQLQNYYNKLKDDYAEIWIVYLKLWEEMPSDNSLGNLSDKVIEDSLLTISYNYHITNWIGQCILQCAQFPTLRETLVQYNKLIKDLTGNSMSAKQHKEIYKLLSKGSNIHEAATLYSSWNYVRQKVELEFWQDFEKVITSEYTILDIQKYSERKIDDLIDRSRNKDPWYGLMFQVYKMKNDKICMFIERGTHEIYYGLTVLNRNNQRTDNVNKKYKLLADELTGIAEWNWNDDDPFWLGGNYLTDDVDFEQFDNQSTLSLINKEYREKYIATNWELIKSFIAKSSDIIKAYEEQLDS